MTDFASMSQEAALARLHAGSLGRIAVPTPRGPKIVPVSYGSVVRDGHEVLVFRAAPHSLLADQHRGTSLSLEIDNISSRDHVGWTVQVTGRFEPVTDPADVDHVEHAVAWPRWPLDGSQPRYFALIPSEVDGRVIGEMKAGRRPPVTR